MRRLGKPRDFLKTAIIFAIILGAVVFFANHSKIKTSGYVNVIDGDSLVVDGQRIRLFGIDAPEKQQICHIEGAAYSCGGRSQQALQHLVQSGDTTCEGWDYDKYNRLLGVCFVGQKEINREMVLQGWAISFGDYHLAERQARSNKVGVWQGTFDTPAKWRKRDEASHKRGVLSSLIFW